MTRPTGAASVETVALRPGNRISRLVRGGWQLAGDHGPVESERAVAGMTAFVDAGIATFDCADIYTGVEEMIGAFLARLAGARAARPAPRRSRSTPSTCPISRRSAGSTGPRSRG